MWLAAMADTEETGFVIRDKRGQARDESVSGAVRDEAVSPSPSPSSSATLPPSPDSGPPQAGQPLSFSSFVFSLGTSALMLMGEQLSPDQPSPTVNLPQAKEIIDILAILENKTQGNLTEDEAAIMRDLLYTLQMKYVGLASGSSPSS